MAIPAGAWALMRTDWSKRSEPDAFLNIKDDGPHVPGPSAAAVRLLIERDVIGFGSRRSAPTRGRPSPSSPPSRRTI